MVRGPDHKDAVVGLEAVDFVEEVGAHSGGDEGVEVFEDEDAGGGTTGVGEDEGGGVFGTGVAEEN